MKKVPTQDLFATQRWLYMAVTDPYQVFAEAFSATYLSTLRWIIKSLLHYAETDKIFRGKSPSEVLFFTQIIHSVIKAADRLKGIRSGPLSVSEEDVFNIKYFRSHYVVTDVLEDFPRFLSVKEYCNPYKVFRKFFGYQNAEKWQTDLDRIVDAALSEHSHELGFKMIAIYSHLTKLIEAAHLINVREVTHIGGILKNRFISR